MKFIDFCFLEAAKKATKIDICSQHVFSMKIIDFCFLEAAKKATKSALCFQPAFFN